MKTRALLVALAWCALAAAAPHTASAAHVDVVNGRLQILGGDEQNTVQVSSNALDFVVTDAAGATAGTGCSQNGSEVDCPQSSITSILGDFGSGDDSYASSAATSASVLGGPGSDTLSGGPGKDSLIGGPGDDRLMGGDGDDVLRGETTSDDPSTGANTLEGGPGTDMLFGGGGVDTMDGGPGSDTVNGYGGDDVVGGGDGDDALSGGDGSDALNGDAGDDTLGRVANSVSAGDDGEGGDDRFDGGEGNDLLRPGGGANGQITDADSLGGGPGVDTVTYASRTTAVIVSVDGRANDGATGEHDDVRADVEHIVGGSRDDVITGGAGPEILDGGLGNDRVRGGGGDDYVDGGTSDPGNDDLSGGEGADTVVGNAGDDTLAGDAGNDKVSGGDGVDTEAGGTGNDDVTGGAGSDVLVAGGPGDDTVDGSAPGVIGDGNDTVAGGPGTDALAGGAGDDRLDGGPGSDTLSGGAGTDQALFSSARRGIIVTLDGIRNDGAPHERDNVGSDVEDVRGGSVEDTVTGNGEANSLEGGAGEDYVDGSGGPDRLSGGKERDVVDARDGVADEVDCGSGGDLAILDRHDRPKPGCELRDTPSTHTPLPGRRIVLQPLRGVGFFGLKGMHRTVPLRETLGLPLGSRADATRGAVELRATRGRRLRQSQSARLSGGAFLVKQPSSAPTLTELQLRGGKLIKCGSQTTQRRSLLTRARGRFRVKGRWSSSTGRGHAWLVEERCGGTYTRAIGGTVTVHDVPAGRTITLKNGQHYLARRGNR